MQLDNNFRIAREKHEAALAAVRSLVGKETIHSATGPHFSFVPTDWLTRANTLHAALLEWGWLAEDDPSTGDIAELYFERERWGDDVLLFQVIAPFLDDGSYIVLALDTGETAEIGRFRFSNGQLYLDEGRITFHESYEPVNVQPYTHFRSRSRHSTDNV